MQMCVMAVRVCGGVGVEVVFLLERSGSISQSNVREMPARMQRGVSIFCLEMDPPGLSDRHRWPVFAFERNDLAAQCDSA